MIRNKWTVLFVIILSLWAIILYYTLGTTVGPMEPLVDEEYDITAISLLFLGVLLFYYGYQVFIFITYFFTFNKVVSLQQKAIFDYSDIISENSGFKNSPNEMCSIIIPAHNEENIIKRTILACLKQTYSNIEVLVVGHNCSDNTEKNAEINDPRVRRIGLKTSDAGKGLALNYGLKKARGKYLLIIDGDGILEPDFIEKTLPLFQGQPKVGAIQGRYISSNRNYNLITKLLSMEADLWSVPFMTIRTFFGKKCPLGGTGFIIRREVLVKIGFFENHLVDDYELSFRLIKNKFQTIFAPLSICYDEKPPSIQVMINQRSRWFKGFVNLLRHAIASPKDILGFIHWLMPISIMAGLGLFAIFAISATHNLVFSYYPFTFTYLPFLPWLVMTVLVICLQCGTLVKQYGLKGLRYSMWIPLFILFSNYWLTVSLKAYFVKSWRTNKTKHGFINEKDLNSILAN